MEMKSETLARFFERRMLRYSEAAPSEGASLRDDPNPKPAANGYSPTTFDTNVVIITAALLCVLICALGINSFVRCALRICTRRIGLESSEEAASRQANTGLKKNEVKSLPTVVYAKGQVALEVGTECSVCLNDFSDGESVRVLPKCRHGFHTKCIDPWLSSHSSCPTCRNSLMAAIAPEKRSAELQIVLATTPSGGVSPTVCRVIPASHASSNTSSASPGDNNRVQEVAVLAATAVAPAALLTIAATPCSNGPLP